MNANKKMKLSITLGEYETNLFNEAMEIAFPKSECTLSPRDDKRRMLDLGLIALFRAIIKQGFRFKEVPMAELRTETPEECRARVAGEMPNRKSFDNPALKALHAKDEELAKKVQELGADEVLKMINNWEIYALVASGRTDKIPANALRFDAKFSGELCAMSKKARLEYAEDVRRQIADLREYLENLKNPDSVKPESALSAAELRYCEAENIKPAHFLKAKSQRKN